MWPRLAQLILFFFNDTATTEIYTLSLHDALPICCPSGLRSSAAGCTRSPMPFHWTDRKSTRLNSSHLVISYAVFCLKKKKNCDIQSIVFTWRLMTSNKCNECKASPYTIVLHILTN